MYFKHKCHLLPDLGQLINRWNASASQQVFEVPIATPSPPSALHCTESASFADGVQFKLSRGDLDEYLSSFGDEDGEKRAERTSVLAARIANAAGLASPHRTYPPAGV